MPSIFSFSSAKRNRPAPAQRCSTPFVILFTERTGSSHLCTVLDSHPEICCRQEDFHEGVITPGSPAPEGVPLFEISRNTNCYRRIAKLDRSKLSGPTDQQAVNHLHDIFHGQSVACGFKFKFPIQHQLYPEIANELTKTGQKLRVISLSRKNVLKQAISRQNMLRIRAATQNTDCNLSDELSKELKRQIRNQPLHVDVPLAIQYARQLTRQRVEFQKACRDLSSQSNQGCLEIEYEDLLHDQAATVDRVLGHLGVTQSIELSSGFVKATSDRLSDAIENYEELATAVAATELAEFLDSDDSMETSNEGTNTPPGIREQAA